MTDPRTVVCPTCNASPADPCTTKTGRATDPHLARRKRAAAIADVTGPSPEAATTTSEHDAHPDDGCAACAAGVPLTHDGDPVNPYAPLPDELTTGLTCWGPWGGAQMSLQTQLLTDDTGELVLNDQGGPTILGADGVMHLAIRDTAPRADTAEGIDGVTVYELTASDARALRDLLNIATARHFL